MSHVLDQTDRKILDVLQKDATISMDRLADRIHLSRNACWRRIRLMEEAGIIRARVALVDPAALGLGLTAIVLIRTNQHEPGWLDTFAKAVRDMPEIIGAHRMSGDLDYVLRVRVPDVQGYDRFYQRLIAKVPIADISASFVMDDIKDTTALPTNT
ncbi:Lrp/AsnC family transcriptional regulator [Aestuariibius sp. 2305UL40-4]|uniref:Lrp/AsnC family transcriptional regulator n=1 Tax=Aestuariibius violaceus TaxID=3234132 RepID=UPI00345E7F1A